MRDRILVVDDDAAVRRIIRRVLEPLGYEVIEIADGADAVLMVETYRPRLVLLDIHMPRLDGIAVADELSQAHPGVAVVMVTGDATEPREQLARERGAAAFLAKPFESDSLKRVVMESLPASAEC
ncbi:MAG: response regulator [Elusimicrobia bacterium]|nr:response regulator [Elusimicrobiota bacterium]